MRAALLGVWPATLPEVFLVILVVGCIVWDLFATWRADRWWSPEDEPRLAEIQRHIDALHAGTTPRPNPDHAYAVFLRGATGGETRRVRRAVRNSPVALDLYRATVENPDDPVPRWMLADWLRERGFDGAADRLVPSEGDR